MIKTTQKTRRRGRRAFDCAALAQDDGGAESADEDEVTESVAARDFRDLKNKAYEYTDGNRTFYVEEILDEGTLSSKQMLIVGADSKPSFLKKYKKLSSSSTDTDVAEQSRTKGISPPATTSKTRSSLLDQELRKLPILQ